MSPALSDVRFLAEPIGPLPTTTNELQARGRVPDRLVSPKGGLFATPSCRCLLVELTDYITNNHILGHAGDLSVVWEFNAEDSAVIHSKHVPDGRTPRLG